MAKYIVSYSYTGMVDIVVDDADNIDDAFEKAEEIRNGMTMEDEWKSLVTLDYDSCIDPYIEEVE